MSGPSHGISKGFDHTPLSRLPRGPAARTTPRASAVDSELKATSSLGQSQQIWFPPGRAGVCVCVCARPARGERRCTLAPRPRGRRARAAAGPAPRARRGAARDLSVRPRPVSADMVSVGAGVCARPARGERRCTPSARARGGAARARRPGPPRGAARARPVGAVVPGVKLFHAPTGTCLVWQLPSPTALAPTSKASGTSRSL